MKQIFFLFLCMFIASACTAVNNKKLEYTGDEIDVKFKKIQKYITNYEVEEGGPILDNVIKIYTIDRDQCVIVSKIEGDSGVYGTESILYFSKSKILYGYRYNYSYSFYNGEGSNKVDKLNYSNPLLPIDEIELKKIFNTFKVGFDQKTKNECG
ncbi:hypothetical protein [Acinetobacter amyesii]|uniref:hypothetical protein n=1 Tax=Acinetobacter TaxID=469 RepID=UPI00201B6C14|nr:hypothetical protein [Acinetobacter amyesii]